MKKCKCNPSASLWGRREGSNGRSSTGKWKEFKLIYMLSLEEVVVSLFSINSIVALPLSLKPLQIC